MLHFVSLKELNEHIWKSKTDKTATARSQSYLN